jgi:hypothetical protein
MDRTNPRGDFVTPTFVIAFCKSFRYLQNLRPNRADLLMNRIGGQHAPSKREAHIGG